MEKIYILFAIAIIAGLIINSFFGLNNTVLGTFGTLGMFLFAQGSGGGSQDGGSQGDQEPEPEPEPTDTSC